MLQNRRHYFLALIVWVMFSNGQVWRYPQAGYWQGVGPAVHDSYKYWNLCNCMSGKTVITLPSCKIKKMAYTMPGYTSQNSHTYQNPKLEHWDDAEVVVIDGMKIVRVVK